MRRCIFCDTPLSGNRAKEHVLPQWLEQEIGDDLTYYGYRINGATGDHFSFEYTGSTLGTNSTRVEGRVCANCNNGWLSAQETAARELISGLVFGRADPCAMSQNERELVASWLYRTFLVAVSSGSGEYAVDPADYQEYQEAHRPGDWANIFIAVMPSTCHGFCGPIELNWTVRNAPDCAHYRPPAPEESSQMGLKWVFHIGQLHVVVCHAALPGAVQVVMDPLHIPIWTPQPWTHESGQLNPEIAGDSLIQWVAFGLLPSLDLSGSCSRSV